MSPQLFIFSHFDILFDGFGSYVIEISPEFLHILSGYVRLIELILNALTFRLFDFLLDIIHILVKVNSSYYLDVVHMVDSANNYRIRISF